MTYICLVIDAIINLSREDRKVGIIMTEETLNWLLEEKNPEVRYRTLTEYKDMNLDSPEVVKAKQLLIESEIFGKNLSKLQAEKDWQKYDGLTSLAEWGLTRKDLEIDDIVFGLIEKTGFKMLCGEPLLLRNLVKLGYYKEEIVEKEIAAVMLTIKEDGGFGCISKNKKLNDPKKLHKSCARFTSGYLMLLAELKRIGITMPEEEQLIQYFRKRNLFYRTDQPTQVMVDGMTETYYPVDAINLGVQNYLYALSLFGVGDEAWCKDGWNFLEERRTNGDRYLLTKTKSVPCFKVGTKGKENKWITLYAHLAKKHAFTN